MKKNLFRYCNIEFDVQALTSIVHACDPMLCRDTYCCCTDYEVSATAAEMRRAVGVMPEAAAFQPELCQDGELINPFEYEGDGLFIIESSEERAGLCVLLSRAGMRSALFSALSRTGALHRAEKGQTQTLLPRGR